MSVTGRGTSELPFSGSSGALRVEAVGAGSEMEHREGSVSAALGPVSGWEETTDRASALQQLVQPYGTRIRDASLDALPWQSHEDKDARIYDFFGLRYAVSKTLSLIIPVNYAARQDANQTAIIRFEDESERELSSLC